MNRRAFLAAAATASSGIAGCLGSGTEDELGHATLQKMDLLNISQEPVTATVRIERDGGAVTHEEGYELPSNDGVALDCVWPDGPIRVNVRCENQESWETLSTVERGGYMVAVAGVSSGRASFYTLHQERPVPDWQARCHTETED